MRSIYVLSLVSALLLGGTLLGCRTENDRTPGQPGEPAAREGTSEMTASDSDLVLVGYALDKQTDRISGSVMNNADEGYVNVQVAFNLYDSGGRMVGTARDSTSEVQPGDVWTFGISVPQQQGVSRVELVGVSGTHRTMIGPGAPSSDSAAQGLVAPPVPVPEAPAETPVP
ncbi:MAG TPA: FxLYD domain-containing protein [Rhodothermales bacterium]|nr:FxLYD domain-containing protein [Rhodothermales bacterium]